jgi:surface polysaccharide O-acyltransferase-like enzyme
MQEYSSSKNLSIEALRIFAAVSVIIIHVCAAIVYNTDLIYSQTYLFTFALDELARPAVPLFFMISGTLFMDKMITYNNLIRKYVARVLFLYIFWTLAYAFYNTSVTEGTDWFSTLVDNLITPPTHLWFFPALMGVYLLIPALQKIRPAPNAVLPETDYGFPENKLLKYLIVVFFSASLVFTICTILNHFSITPRIVDQLEDGYSAIIIYPAYFLLGYYLSKRNVSKSTKRFLYILGLLSIGINATIGVCLSRFFDTPIQSTFSPMSIFVVLQSMAVFLFFINNAPSAFKRRLSNVLVFQLGSCTLGIYVIHVAVIDILRRHIFWGLNLGLHPILEVIVLVPVVFVISFVITWVLKRIPFVKRIVC